MFSFFNKKNRTSDIALCQLCRSEGANSEKTHVIDGVVATDVGDYQLRAKITDKIVAVTIGNKGIAIMDSHDAIEFFERSLGAIRELEDSK